MNHNSYSSSSVNTSKKEKVKNSAKTSLTPPTGTLAAYTGPWNVKEASHLLRRTCFGPNQEMISISLELGLVGTINTLFENAVPSPPPVIYTLPQADPETDLYAVFTDPFVPYGQTWVNEPPIVNTGDEELNQRIENFRTRSAIAWPFVNMMRSELNIMPKLWMFWHNHFVVSDFRIALNYYQYSRLLEDHAKGNFKELTKAITINCCNAFVSQWQ